MQDDICAQNSAGWRAARRMPSTAIGHLVPLVLCLLVTELVEIGTVSGDAALPSDSLLVTDQSKDDIALLDSTSGFVGAVLPRLAAVAYARRGGTAPTVEL